MRLEEDNLMGEGLYIENYIMKKDNDKYREKEKKR